MALGENIIKCVFYGNRYQNVSKSIKVLKRYKSSKTSGVPVEKQLETPIIVMREQDQVEVIGPPDPVSNLRPIMRNMLPNETALQTKLREMQNDTEEWNQNFWANHNKKFMKEKQDFINMLLRQDKDKQITPDEMSEFYKRFLDENWKTHVIYNKEWYIRNLNILWYSIGTHIEKHVGSLQKKFAH
ncbi:COA8 family protein CBG23705, mitochondrial [Diabrotica undecimpunctata]|uniref:COA8 family protein CBG23705, mitochondrial n=1 Tax=Diabrotica undecimpunctata TaxID=50387 RepID=UPI003B636B0A